MNGLDKGLILIFVLSVMISLISLFRGILVGSQAQVEYLEAGENGSNESNAGSNKIVVDIEGAVVLPGVYTLPSNARIKDLLVMAGGFSERADILPNY